MGVKWDKIHIIRRFITSSANPAEEMDLDIDQAALRFNLQKLILRFMI
jgi:hypothetical protein